MTRLEGNSNNKGHRDMREAIRRREQQEELSKREGERSLWQNLSMIGALGWLIVTPTLIGVLLGRWLDHKFDTGIFFSGALIFIGVALGCYLAWQRVKHE